MNKKSPVKAALLFLVGCFSMFMQTTAVSAESKPDKNKVTVTEPATNVNTTYDTYKDNASELMTKEKK